MSQVGWDFLLRLGLLLCMLNIVRNTEAEGLVCRGTYFRPVCGTNGYKYKNLCWLKFYSYYSYEEVDRTTLQECPVAHEHCPCPKDACVSHSNPICGYKASTQEHLTFDNLCEYHCATFCDPYLYFVKCGPCDSTSSYEIYDYDQCLTYHEDHHYPMITPTDPAPAYPASAPAHPAPAPAYPAPTPAYPGSAPAHPAPAPAYPASPGTPSHYPPPNPYDYGIVPQPPPYPGNPVSPSPHPPAPYNYPAPYPPPQG